MPLFLSDEEYSRCSGDGAAVAAKADAFIRGLLHELDTVRAKADAADINAEQNCSLIEQKYLSLTAEFSKLEAQVADLQSSLDQRLRELAEAQLQNHQIQLQSVRIVPKRNICPLFLLLFCYYCRCCTCCDFMFVMGLLGWER